MVCKQINEMSTCFPLAREYNAETLAWQQARISELVDIVDQSGFTVEKHVPADDKVGMSEKDEFASEGETQPKVGAHLADLLCEKANEHNIILPELDGISDADYLRKKLRKAVMATRVPLLEAESFPISHDIPPPTGDDTVGVFHAALLPSPLCALFGASAAAAVDADSSAAEAPPSSVS